MASYYWVGADAVDSWDDNAWANTSGGTLLGAGVKPETGDDVFFDVNSTGAMVNGPASAVSLLTLNFTGSPQSLTAAQTANITVTGMLTATQSTDFGGTLGAASNATFINTSTLASSATVSSGASVNFGGSSTNNCAFTTTGACSMSASSTNAANISTGAFSVSGTVTNSNTITVSSGAVNGVISGGGSIVGPVTIGSGGQNASDHTITGDITINHSSGSNNGPVAGNATISAGFNAGTISGNCTLSGTGKNTSAVTGILTAPGEVNGNGTIGTPQDALGTFGTLNLTGVSTGGDILGAGLL